MKVASMAASKAVMQDRGSHARWRLMPALAAALMLAGCQSWQGGDDDAFTAPAATATVDGRQIDPDANIVCPVFDIYEGGSAVRTGEGQSLRHQISIGQTARECFGAADGSMTVNVGVEVLALLGPAGRPGNVSAPLHIAFRGETDGKVYTTRSRTVTVSIPAGSAQGSARIVEKGFSVPADAKNVLIEIGLGARATQRR